MNGIKISIINLMNKQQLIDFEIEIAKIYQEGKISGPIHLSSGNEDNLIEIFKDYKDGDWIFSTWRNHYHWLLSGRDPEELKKQILEGRSMHVFGDKFFTSSIVGGITPIALGIAKALQMEGSLNKVWCFIGCMAASCGLVSECIRYARGQNLPIIFVVEDNNMSVRAKTRETWGLGKTVDVRIYKYERKYPHAGSGKYVMF
jgi:pyruvate dehydrogenase E1 component alpha subunit